MKKKFVLIFLGAGVIIVALAILLVLFLKPTGGVLLVDASPKSPVLVDGQDVGQTPVERKFSVKEVTVKIGDYETKVSLTRGVKTVVRREFGASEELSAGEEISFEKTGEAGASFAVVTTPDSAEILIDGKREGFSPLKISKIDPGEHVLTVTSQGYVERSFSIKPEVGYRLTAVVTLAKNPDYKKPDLVPKNVEGTKTTALQMVEILTTPTGYLRVRKGHLAV